MHVYDLDFLDCDGGHFADFHTGFAAQTFFSVHRHGLAVLKLIHFHGAHIHTFAAADTLVRVHGNIPSHGVPPFGLGSFFVLI
jgi:hypothetical protein